MLIQVANVSSLEPVIFKGCSGFLGHVPVAFEHGRPAHQHFSVRRDSHFEVRQDLSHRANAVLARNVHCDDRRSLGQSVAFVDPNANVGVPGRELASQWRTSGEEEPGAATYAFSDFLKYHSVRQLPRQ